MINKIKRFKLVVFFFRLINLRYSYCEKCGLPWKHCKEKSVNSDSYSSYFATCQYCWDHSSLEEIKNCYRKANFKYWISSNGNGGNLLPTLLRNIEEEYKNDITIRRSQKIKSLKKNIKKNVTLFKEN